jgi:hypothetical protein
LAGDKWQLDHIVALINGGEHRESNLAPILDAEHKAKTKAAGTYVTGDFHNHSTCSDGAVSLQEKVARAMNRTAESPWGLDWFVQAGHGGSGKLYDPALYGAPIMAEDARRLLDHLGIDAVHYIGESIGGLIGATAAARYPARFRSLTLISTPLSIPNNSQQLAQSPGFADTGEAILKLGMRQWWIRKFSRARRFGSITVWGSMHAV